MWLQLRAAHTKGGVKLHRPHRRIGLKDNLDIVIKVHIEIDLTGIAMRTTLYLTKIGMSIGSTAAGGAKQIPGHIEYSHARGTQEHLEHRPATFIPMISKRIRPDALEGQIIGLVKERF